MHHTLGFLSRSCHFWYLFSTWNKTRNRFISSSSSKTSSKTFLNFFTWCHKLQVCMYHSCFIFIIFKSGRFHVDTLYIVTFSWTKGRGCSVGKVQHLSLLSPGMGAYSWEHSHPRGGGNCQLKHAWSSCLGMKSLCRQAGTVLCWMMLTLPRSQEKECLC